MPATDPYATPNRTERRRPARRRRIARDLLACLAVAAAGGCYLAKPLAVGDTDAGDTDTSTEAGDTDTGPVDEVCSGIFGRTCHQLDPERLSTALEAQDLAGSGALRFVAMDAYAILASRDAGLGPEPILLLTDDWYEGFDLDRAALVPMDVPSQLEPVDVAAFKYAWGTDGATWTYAALLCSTSACSIWGVPAEWDPLDTGGGEVDAQTDLPTGWMQLIDEPALLAGREVRGIAAHNPDSEWLCAFGDGLCCFDGEGWTEEIPAGTGGAFNDCTLSGLYVNDTPSGTVVGDIGRLVVHRPSGWETISTGTWESLSAVTETSGGVWAGGEGGSIVAVFNVTLPGDQATVWSVADAPISIIDRFGVFHAPMHSGIHGLTVGDCAFEMTQPGYEVRCWGAHSLDGPVLDEVPWGDETQVFQGALFMTANAVHRWKQKPL